MDLNMPIKDGFKAAKELRKLHSQGILNLANTKLIAVSSITQETFYQTQNHEAFD